MAKYRMVIKLKCDCGASHGQLTERFNADNDEEARNYSKQWRSSRNPPRGHQGLRYHLKSLCRIDQEEVVTDL